ncbi:hypothetical protein MMC22_012091 [Lobaria immixta]|nr:hypothetical protein [Lobaria immixta]
MAKLFSLQTTSLANLFVTSRFIPNIVERFEGQSIQLEIRANGDDLEKYLDGNISKLPSFVSYNTDLRKEIESTIINAVDGMFLLAELHLNSLTGKRSPKATTAALGKLPQGSEAYNQAYRETMERIEKQGKDSCELAKQILSWIFYAKKPMTTLKLQHALAVEVGESELDEENFPEIKDMISVCAGLVTVDEGSNIIRLVHYTAQEFFEQAQKDWFPDAEIDIARICAIYLSFDVFESGFCLSNEDFDSRLRLNPFYDYAARNWGHHIRKAPDAEFSIPTFLEKENTVSSCSQAMMVPTNYCGQRYSQNVPRQMTGVHLTAWFGLVHMTSKLIRNGFPSDRKNEYGQTPLSYAAKYGHEAVVKLLMERDDVETDSKDNNGQTPLSWATWNGHEAVANLLMTRDDVDLDLKDNSGQTPLSRAALNGHEAVVKLLMTRDNVKINSKDRYGCTPLWYAACYGHEAVVKLLMTQDNIEMDSKDNDGQTPLSRAAFNGHETVVKLLMTRDDIEMDSKDNKSQTPLSKAALKGREAVVKLLMTRDDIKMDSKNNNGQTALLMAAWSGHEAVVKLLMTRHDVKIDLKDNGGQTPLLMAALSGHDEMVKMLMMRDDVEINSKDSDGQTPLLMAASNGHEVVVKLLMTRDNVEMDLKDNNGQTPLMMAASNGHEAVVKLLMTRDNVEMDLKDSSGQTPLMMAASNEHEAVVKLLMTRDNVEVDLKD